MSENEKKEEKPEEEKATPEAPKERCTECGYMNQAGSTYCLGCGKDISELEPVEVVFPIYVKKKVIDQITKLCKKSDLEVFGYLVGELHEWNSTKYIVISEQISVRAGTDSRDVSVQLLADSMGLFDEKFQKLKNKNANLLNIGWWHSHPGFGCFLSAVDLTTQREQYPSPHETALVVDPVNDDLKFFKLDGSSEKGYREDSYAIIK